MHNIYYGHANRANVVWFTMDEVTYDPRRKRCRTSHGECPLGDRQHNFGKVREIGSRRNSKGVSLSLETKKKQTSTILLIYERGWLARGMGKTQSYHEHIPEIYIFKSQVNLDMKLDDDVFSIYLHFFNLIWKLSRAYTRNITNRKFLNRSLYLYRCIIMYNTISRNINFQISNKFRYEIR